MFELLVVRDALRVEPASDAEPFAYAADLDAAVARVRAAHGPAAGARLARQEANAAAAAPQVAALIRERAASRGPVRAVRWIGRHGGLAVTVADVAVEHAGGQTAISCKSTRVGSGTLRNLGASALLELLGVDAGALNGPMYAAVLAEWEQTVTPARHAELAALPVSDRRHHLTRSERVTAAGVGRQVMEVLTAQLQSAMARAGQDQLRLVAAAALGIPPTPDPDLFVLVANDHGAHVRPAPGAVPPGTITAAQVSGTRIVVSVDSRPLWAWQVNCTNGKGLSPLCVRSFPPPRR